MPTKKNGKSVYSKTYGGKIQSLDTNSTPKQIIKSLEICTHLNDFISYFCKSDVIEQKKILGLIKYGKTETNNCDFFFNKETQFEIDESNEKYNAPLIFCLIKYIPSEEVAINCLKYMEEYNEKNIVKPEKSFVEDFYTIYLSKVSPVLINGGGPNKGTLSGYVKEYSDNLSQLTTFMEMEHKNLNKNIVEQKCSGTNRTVTCNPNVDDEIKKLSTKINELRNNIKSIINNIKQPNQKQTNIIDPLIKSDVVNVLSWCIYQRKLKIFEYIKNKISGIVNKKFLINLLTATDIVNSNDQLVYLPTLIFAIYKNNIRIVKHISNYTEKWYRENDQNNIYNITNYIDGEQSNQILTYLWEKDHNKLLKALYNMIDDITKKNNNDDLVQLFKRTDSSFLSQFVEYTNQLFPSNMFSKLGNKMMSKIKNGWNDNTKMAKEIIDTLFYTIDDKNKYRILSTVSVCITKLNSFSDTAIRSLLLFTNKSNLIYNFDINKFKIYSLEIDSNEQDDEKPRFIVNNVDVSKSFMDNLIVPLLLNHNPSSDNFSQILNILEQIHLNYSIYKLTSIFTEKNKTEILKKFRPESTLVLDSISLLSMFNNEQISNNPPVYKYDVFIEILCQYYINITKNNNGLAVTHDLFPILKNKDSLDNILSIYDITQKTKMQQDIDKLKNDVKYKLNELTVFLNFFNSFIKNNDNFPKVSMSIKDFRNLVELEKKISKNIDNVNYYNQHIDATNDLKHLTTSYSDLLEIENETRQFVIFDNFKLENKYPNNNIEIIPIPTTPSSISVVLPQSKSSPPKSTSPQPINNEKEKWDIFVNKLKTMDYQQMHDEISNIDIKIYSGELKTYILNFQKKCIDELEEYYTNNNLFNNNSFDSEDFISKIIGSIKTPLSPTKQTTPPPSIKSVTSLGGGSLRKLKSRRRIKSSEKKQKRKRRTMKR